MSYLKEYIDENVYEEAKKRLHHIYDSFDSVCISFSGGKDSLAVLHLNNEVRKEREITSKPIVIFRDEELIPDNVIDFVQSYYNSGEYDFRYYAVPLKSTKFILGKSYEYIQWDTGREWIRPKPEFAITSDEVFDQYSMDKFATRDLKGKIALVCGIRSDESLFRFRACVNKKNENYINATSSSNIKICKPIFDWTEKDVFKYFYDKGIKYCPIYDDQMWNQDSLRVSTPLHAESAKKFQKLRTTSPVLYQQVVNIFPEMRVQELYWSSYDQYGILSRYEKSWNGIVKYIKENIKDTAQQKRAIQILTYCKEFKYSRYKSEPNAKKTLGGYPLFYVFKNIISGNYKRKLMPVSQVSSADLLYESESCDANK